MGDACNNPVSVCPMYFYVTRLTILAISSQITEKKIKLLVHLSGFIIVKSSWVFGHCKISSFINRSDTTLYNSATK